MSIACIIRGSLFTWAVGAVFFAIHMPLSRNIYEIKDDEKKQEKQTVLNDVMYVDEPSKLIRRYIH